MDVNLHDIGDKVRMAAAFTSGGVAFDPTAVVFKLKLPSGTIVTYTYGTDAELVKDSTGNYHVDYKVTIKGAYHYYFDGTGAIEAAEEDSFFVNESNFS